MASSYTGSGYNLYYYTLILENDKKKVYQSSFELLLKFPINYHATKFLIKRFLHRCLLYLYNILYTHFDNCVQTFLKLIILQRFT